MNTEHSPDGPANDEAQAYRDLGPDQILNAVESLGLRCDGRFLALNSYENRVYQVGLTDGSPVVAKFYRPGRWSDEAILEEHTFSQALADLEIPVVPPEKDEHGRTLHRHGPFRYALYPRRGGRAPDLETLELLEELLLNYQGTLLLVSHDRAFLNNVVTSTLVFEGAGQIGEYVGGYDDWLRQRRPPQSPKPAPASPVPPKARRASSGPRKLGYAQQRELASLPQRIETLEKAQAELHESMADPAFYQQDGAIIAATKARLSTLDQELEKTYRRWEELEATLEP